MSDRKLTEAQGRVLREIGHGSVHASPFMGMTVQRLLNRRLAAVTWGPHSVILTPAGRKALKEWEAQNA